MRKIYYQLFILFPFSSFLTCITSNAVGQQQSGTSGFIQLFDGKSLAGWEGDNVHWKVEAGKIVGEVTSATPLKANTFLIWKGGLTEDFELVAEYHITKAGNSGINYRSELLKDIPFALKGYQADIDGADTYTGQNYEERGRGFLAMRGQQVDLEAMKKPRQINSLGDSATLKSIIKNDNWNEIRIVAKRNRLQHYINGVLMSDVTDNDPDNRKTSGILGLQVHVGPTMRTEYRNIRYRKI